MHKVGTGSDDPDRAAGEAELDHVVEPRRARRAVRQPHARGRDLGIASQPFVVGQVREEREQVGDRRSRWYGV
jgi:hypothetical protein